MSGDAVDTKAALGLITSKMENVCLVSRTHTDVCGRDTALAANDTKMVTS